jgi:protein-disulfide isomerase
MKLRSVGGALLSLGLLVGACSPAGESAPRTDNTTASLLAQTPSGGASEIPAAGPAQEAPKVDIATLGFNRGSKDAPVRVVELSDYGCGFCRKFHMETFPTLLDEFVESGKVEWKFLPFITGMFDNSPAATEGAECALAQSSDAFEALNERLWTDQSDWKKSGDPEAVVRGMAKDAGVDLASYDTCIADDSRMDRIRASTALAQQLGVRGTPTFFVVGYPPLQGALPTETFRQVLTAVYKKAVENDGN